MPIGSIACRWWTRVAWRGSLLSLATALWMVVSLPLQAADDPPPAQHAMPHHDPAMMAQHSHGSMAPPDGRELVFFPPEMRMHQMREMRDHMATLNAIVSDLAAADYEGAANLAADRLGLESPSAAGCLPQQPDAPPPPKGSMEEMMDLYMPAQMKAFGLAMHTSASDLAAVARAAAATGDTAAVLHALSLITQQCVACHAAYRLQ